MTIDTGATLTTLGGGYYTRAYSNVTNSGTITGNGFIMRGSSLVNNGTISTTNLSFDSTTSLSGTGAYTANSISINSSGNVSLANNVTFSPAGFQINSGGKFSPNGRTFTINSGTFTLNGGGTVINSGIFQTQASVSLLIRNSSNFNGALRISTGTATSYNDQSPNIANYFGSVTVNAGTLLTTLGGGYTSRVYGNLINNGTIAGTRFSMRGSSLTNNSNISPTNLDFDSTTTLSGTGSYTAGVISVTSSGNVSLANNLSFSPSSSCQVNGSGLLNPNTKTFSFSSGTFVVLNGGTVSGSGIFQTRGNVGMILRNGSIFNATFKVDSGTTTSYSDESPNIANYFGTMTVNTGAVFTTPGGGYTNRCYGNILNNGTIGGTSFTMRGDMFTNNGTVNSNTFNFDTTIALSGTGVWVSNNINITGTGILNLSNSLSFGGSGGVTLRINASGLLNPNSFDAVFDGSSATITLESQSGSATSNSGRIVSKGNTIFNLRTDAISILHILLRPELLRYMMVILPMSLF